MNDDNKTLTMYWLVPKKKANGTYSNSRYTIRYNDNKIKDMIMIR